MCAWRIAQNGRLVRVEPRGLLRPVTSNALASRMNDLPTAEGPKSQSATGWVNPEGASVRCTRWSMRALDEREMGETAM